MRRSPRRSEARSRSRGCCGDAHRFGRLNCVGEHEFAELGGGDARDRPAREHAVGDVGRDARRAASTSASAALQSVPPESTMSSNRTQRRSGTSPMMFITSETPARRGACRRWRVGVQPLGEARARTTPPTSGETIISSCGRCAAAGCRRTIVGAATGCRSGCRRSPGSGRRAGPSVSTRSAPARVIRLATSLAEIGVRAADLAILPRIAVVGHHRRDAPRRRPPQGVDQISSSIRLSLAG